MDEFEDDDLEDLYADVEVQVSSAINAMKAITQLPQEDDEVYGNGDDNVDFQEAEEGVGCENAEAGEEKDEEEAEGEEDDNESDSESEDDFNIVLNEDEDNDNDNANGNVNGGKDAFLTAGKGGRVGNDEEYGIEEENEGNNGVENGGSGERSSGGKGGGSGGGYISRRYKYMRAQSTAFSSNLKSNVSVASYRSTFVRGDGENDDFTYQLGTSLIRPQSGHSFSLLRSRTILDVNIDALEQKPWRKPGADITDFFNFGFNEDSWKIYCSHPRKGRAIQVEDSFGERQPSVDIRLPIGRDSDVVIEIPVHDLEEDRSDSDKVASDETTNYLHEASDNRDAEDMLCFSASEDEQPILEGNTERTGKSDPHKSVLHSRCIRDTSTANSDPSGLDSDNSGSFGVSDADEQQHEVRECDSDGLAEERKVSDEPEKGVGRGKPTTTPKKTPESSQREQSQHSQRSSPSQSDNVGSRGGAYKDPDEFHDHSKRASPVSASELQESIIVDYHSSKDSRNQGFSMRSGNFKCVGGSRSTILRNIKFQERRSSRMSRFKDNLYDENASHMSDGEELHGALYPAVGCQKERSRNHDFDSYEYKDKLYHEELEHCLNYRRARFPSKAGTAFAGYSHGKENQGCGYNRDLYPCRNVNGKRHFPEQRNPWLSDEVMERKWKHHRKGISVQEMDSSNYDLSRQSITEQSPYLDNRNHTRSKRKADDLHFKQRMKNDDLSTERYYRNDFMQVKYIPIPYNGRERDCFENRHERQLPYSRREVNVPLKSRRRCGSSGHGCEGIWYNNCEDESSRYARNQFSFRSYGGSQTAGRGRGRGWAAPLSRNDMFEKHGRRRRQNCVERYRDSNKLDGYADGYVNDYGRIQDTQDHDKIVDGRQYQQSEVLHLSEEEYNRHREDNFEAWGTAYPFGRTSGCKRFDSKPLTGCQRKPKDGREPDEKRYKMPIEGNRCSQFDGSSHSVHRDNLGQALPSCWDSTDSHMFVGDNKSSRCFGARSLMYYGGYDFLDRNDNLDQRTLNGFNEPYYEKIARADSRKINGFQDDANWCEKLSDSLQNDSLDIEEGQIVSEDLNKKPMQKASALGDARNFCGAKNFPSENSTHQHINVEELENPRIMEILAKLEKRRERFQQPMISKNVSENHTKPFADLNTKPAGSKIRRPARKRKWDGI